MALLKWGLVDATIAVQAAGGVGHTVIPTLRLNITMQS